VKGHAQVVQVLMEAGADITTQDKVSDGKENEA
jgi:hypothetical protein